MAKSSEPPQLGLSLTPIPSAVDLKQMDSSIRKIASAVNKSARHTERIPEIQKKVEGTSSKVIELGVKMDITTERVTKIESKIEAGHDCHQELIISEIKDSQRESSQKIETDIQSGIKRSGEIRTLRGRAETLEVNIDDIRKAPRKLFLALIGILFTVVSGLGGGIWFLAELSKDVEFERSRREEQFEDIEKQLTGIGVKVDPNPINSNIKRLESVVKASSDVEEEFNKLCDNMPRGEKRVIRGTLLRRDKRIPTSCLE